MLFWPPVNMIKAKRFAFFFFFILKTAKLLCGSCWAAWPLLQCLFQPVLREGAGLWVHVIANLSAGTLNFFLAVCAQRTLAVQEGTESRPKSLLPSHRHGKVWDPWLLGPLGGEDGSGISLSPASFQLIPSFKLVLCWEIISSACNFAG